MWTSAAPRGAPSAELGGLDLASGAKFGGNFSSFEVWVYSDFYDDETDGTTKPVFPAGTVPRRFR